MDTFFIIIFVVALIFACVYQANAQKKADQNAKACAERNQLRFEQYIENRNRLVPDVNNALTVTKIEPYGKITVKFSHFIWVSDDTLHLFPSNIFVSPPGCQPLMIAEDKISHTAIPLDEILCYRQIGEVFTTIEGHGGQSSYSFFTGVNGKIEPIKITTTVHDERTTQLFYGDAKSSHTLVLGNDDFYTLKKLIPHKDYDVVNVITAAELEKENSSTQTIQQRITTLKTLYEQELITEAEYEKKKGEILSML